MTDRDEAAADVSRLRVAAPEPPPVDPAPVLTPGAVLGLWAQRRGQLGGHWVCSAPDTPVLGETAADVFKALENGSDGAFEYRPTPFDPAFKGYPVGGRGPTAGPQRALSTGRSMFELPAAPNGVERVAAKVVDIDLPHEPGESVYNPSLAVRDGRLLASVRVERAGKNRTVLVEIDLNDGTLKSPHNVHDYAPGAHLRARGFEDVRLFTRARGSNGGNGSGAETLHAVATVALPRPHIAILDFDDKGDVRGAYVQDSPRDERNWMPLVTGRELRFIYALEPTTTIVLYDDRTHVVRPAPGDIAAPGGTLRGGAQVIPYKGSNFLAIVHHVHWRDGTLVYWHRFVELDRFLQIRRKSPPWCFGDPERHLNKEGVEFVAGVVVWGGEFVLSFGHADRTAHLARVAPDEIERLLDGGGQ